MLFTVSLGEDCQGLKFVGVSASPTGESAVRGWWEYFATNLNIARYYLQHTYPHFAFLALFVQYSVFFFVQYVLSIKRMPLAKGKRMRHYCQVCNFFDTCSLRNISAQLEDSYRSPA